MLQVYGSSPNVNVGWCALCLALRVYARWRMCGACKRERAERGRGSFSDLRARKRDGLLILCCVLFGNIVLSTATLRVDKGIGLSPSNAARGLTRGRAYTPLESATVHICLAVPTSCAAQPCLTGSSDPFHAPASPSRYDSGRSSSMEQARARPDTRGTENALR